MAETTPIISLAQALGHLREDEGAADDMVRLYANAATQHAMDYLGRQVFASEDEMKSAVESGTAGDAPMVANDAVRAAILLTLGKLYAYREDAVAGVSSSVIELPGGAKALLFPYRVGLGV